MPRSRPRGAGGCPLPAHGGAYRYAAVQPRGCARLKVKTAQGQEGWVARVTGSSELVTLNAPCDSVPQIVLPTPVPKPKPKPTNPQTDAASPDEYPNLGCYLIRNHLGTEPTFTLKAVNWNGRDSFRVPDMSEKIYCLGPGKYTHTIGGEPPGAPSTVYLT
jgi:hypothetical protein